MNRMLVTVLVLTLAFGVAPAALADHSADEHSDNMELVGNWDDDGDYRQGSDLAFWGNLAVLGKYNGLQLLDISRPEQPRPLGKLECTGGQHDVSVWKDLVFVSVDSPMESDACDAEGASTLTAAAGNAWEGIRIVDVSNREKPEQVASVDTDCGSHTHTLVPDTDHHDPVSGKPDPRVLLYVSSYPLGGQGENCNAASHRKVSVVEVPLKDPSRAQVVSTPDVSPAIGCHDITVFEPRELAVAACISESQVWDISDPADPQVVSHIVNPATEIHHSSAVSWDGDIAVIGDEMGGAAGAAGCLSGGTAPTGALYFYDIRNPELPVLKGSFTNPDNEVSPQCTAHNFNVVPLEDPDRRVLVTSWYHGGTLVIDFSDPSAPEQIGFYRPKEGVRGTPWSSYWYNGYIYANNFDAGYVPSVPESRGFDVFTIDHPALRDHIRLPRLNPQTQEALPSSGGGSKGKR